MINIFALILKYLIFLIILLLLFSPVIAKIIVNVYEEKEKRSKQKHPRKFMEIK